MGRSDSFYEILEAGAQIQKNIAVILEAKAEEAEKTRQWICGHMQPEHYPFPSGLHKQTLEIHDHLVEIIHGITKMEQGLFKNLKVILSKEEDGGGGLGGMFGEGDMQ